VSTSLTSSYPSIEGRARRVPSVSSKCAMNPYSPMFFFGSNVLPPFALTFSNVSSMASTLKYTTVPAWEGSYVSPFICEPAAPGAFLSPWKEGHLARSHLLRSQLQAENFLIECFLSPHVFDWDLKPVHWICLYCNSSHTYLLRQSQLIHSPRLHHSSRRGGTEAMRSS
jgi:hypothetical protein